MTASSGDYELLDFGEGRKLERFGAVVLDRPCPAAEGVKRARPEAWNRVAARFPGSRAGDGRWEPEPKKWLPADWYFANAGEAKFRLQLAALPSGQVGVFPEQRENWEWIARRVAKPLLQELPLPLGEGWGEGEVPRTKTPSPRHGESPAATCPLPEGEGFDSGANPRAAGGKALKILNLFAYTGGSTLAGATGGAEVVHVDAARGMVERARENAALSGLADRPIRWITDDALKFCRREVKRGNLYDGVILDPPTYGHGPKGEPWKIDQHLLPLLRLCGELTEGRRAFVLVTCHAPGIGPAELGAYVAEGICGHCGQPATTGELYLATADGRRLPSGVFARWPN